MFVSGSRAFEEMCMCVWCAHSLIHSTAFKLCCRRRHWRHCRLITSAWECRRVAAISDTDTIYYIDDCYAIQLKSNLLFLPVHITCKCQLD